MSNPTLTGQDEARRAQIADWIERSLTNNPNQFLARPLFEKDADWRIILAALRAPSLDRGAEKMRERIAKAAHDHTHKQNGVLCWDELQQLPHGPGYCEQRAYSLADAIIRALPVPADLNEGGGK